MATSNWKPRATSAKSQANVPARRLAWFGAAAKYAKTVVSHDFKEMRERVTADDDAMNFYRAIQRELYAA